MPVLEPDGRAALTEQLRPPTGFALVHAVGTTFTLDLTSALSVPLSFAGHRVRESDDPIAILDAVRRAAESVDVFAQAGQVAVPRQSSDLVAFLEPMVHPVVAPRRGSLFHPKVWVLEFARDGELRHRLLCSSRNLTADRSWDVMVRLDSVPGVRGDSAPLADLVRALPGMAVAPLPDDRRVRIAALADRIADVAWEPPGDTREVALHAFGIGRPVDIDFGGARHVVISPFLSDDGIALVTERAREKVMVLSRAESLESLSPETLARVQGFVLDDAARDTDEPDDDPLVGLHAKVVGLDRMNGSRLFVGSANATGAAYGGNVEFVVELVLRGRAGVDAVFGDAAPLRSLVVPYDAVGGAQPSDADRADRALEAALREFAALRLRTTVAEAGEGTFDASVEALGVVPSRDEFTAGMTLLTRPGNLVPLPVPGAGAVFAGIPLTDVTPFVVIRLSDSRGEERSTVVRADLVGDPPHRRDAVLARQIDSPHKFLKFLLLLLSLGGADGTAVTLDGSGGFGDWAEDGGGVFESLVAALGARSGSLDDLARLVNRLREDNPSVLPEGFDALWSSIWSAHETLRRQGR